MLNERPAAAATLSLDPSLLSSTQRAALGNGFSRVLSAGVQPELRSEQKVRSRLKTTLDDYGTLETLTRGRRGLRLVTTGALVSDLGNAGTRIGRLHGEITALKGFSREIVTLSTPGVQVVQTDPGALTGALVPAWAGDLDAPATGPARDRGQPAGALAAVHGDRCGDDRQLGMADLR